MRAKLTVVSAPAGFSVNLARREPQGINPADLLLMKEVRAPAGVAAAALTTVGVDYQEETDFEYETVTVLPDGFPTASRRA